jgi:hypothetical protein
MWWVVLGAGSVAVVFAWQSFPGICMAKLYLNLHVPRVVLVYLAELAELV